MEILSPIHQIQLPSKIQIWVKRDDLIDPFISGNKWRKLKYIIKAAADQQKNHLVTFGGAFSNHLVATAAAAARHNFKSTGFVRGEEITNEMLLICKLFGMNLIFVDRESYKNKAYLYHQYFGEDNNTYFIDEGGACAEAVMGCEEIIDELPKDINHLFCAAGTGTTAAGLLKGLIRHNHHAQLHIIPVLKGGEFIKAEIAKHETDLSMLNLHTNYHFGGYAKTTPELINFIRTFTQSTGMLIDPVYTGKLFFAIDDLNSKGYFKKEDKILAIHTGGLLGMFGMKEKFKETLS